MKRFSTLSALTVALVLTFASAASATSTLGTTTTPGGASLNGCGTNTVINQVTSDPAVPYSVPAAGTITQWQHNTESGPDIPGAPLTLVVLRPAGSGFNVVGVDARTVPNPLPAGGVATYPLATPIAVQAGDTFGLYTNAAGAAVCYWRGGSTPLAATLAALTELSPPAPNQALNRSSTDSPGGYTMNLAATFEPTPPPPPSKSKKCKKKKHKRSAESAKKKCKKKKKG